MITFLPNSPMPAAMFRVICLLACVVLSLPLCLQAETSGSRIFVQSDLYWPEPAVSKADGAKAHQAYEKATAAADAGQTSLALQLAAKTLTFNPDHSAARHVLGYQNLDGRWVTPFQNKQLARGMQWDARFGWIRTAEMSRYEADERPLGRKWISAEEDAKRHARIENGWRVRTDHFQVTTNHSRQAAAELAVDLEKLFQAWRQLFAGYYLGDAEVRARFAGKRSARQRSRPFNVIYHKRKSDYVVHLRHKQPRISETIGIYFDDTREAHFYSHDPAEEHPADPAGQDSAIRRGTLYHEAVHQLFQESGRVKKNVGSKANFWLVEGIACYFESLTQSDSPDGSLFQIGMPGDGRLPAAKHRLLADNFYVPLMELSSLGREDLQRRSDIAPLYSQSAGLATFLMHAGQAQHRETLVAALRDLYDGRLRTASELESKFGSDFSDLDAGYRKFIRSSTGAP